MLRPCLLHLVVLWPSQAALEEASKQFRAGVESQLWQHSVLLIKHTREHRSATSLTQIWTNPQVSHLCTVSPSQGLFFPGAHRAISCSAQCLLETDTSQGPAHCRILLLISPQIKILNVVNGCLPTSAEL